MAHKDEYHDNMVAMVELIKGDLYPRMVELLG
jgi:hypothetical protein